MDDKKIKGIAADLLRNKDKVFRLLDYLRPEDIERGTLILPDQLVNEELWQQITELSAPYLTNYRLTSTGTSTGLGGPDGLLFLDLDLWIKQLGKLQARYMLTISELTFTAESRRVAFSYREDVKCLGNPLQAMALKALLGDRTLLMKAADLAGLTPGSGRNPVMSANRQAAVIDLSRLSFQLPEFLDCLNLKYEGAGEGFVRFRFSFR